MAVAPTRVFAKHPLDYDTVGEQRRAAKAMLANAGKLVLQVYAIDIESIAYVTTQKRAYTAFIEPTADDAGFQISPIFVSGWPISTD